MPLNATRLQQQAEIAAGPLPPLLVAAERVASTVAQGVHGRRRVGQGETFWQFREYDPGDRPQSIDWRQTAKSDRIFVRQTEWEAAQSVWLWRDRSASMSWRSGGEIPEKRERADILALALGVLLVQAGEQLALIDETVPPRGGRAALSRVAAMMERQADNDLAAPAGGPGDLPLAQELPRHAHLVLFGDFLRPLEEVARTVARFSEQGVKGHIVQILDPAEESLPYSGRVRFEGLEEGEEPWLLSKVEAVRASYIRRLQRQRFGLEDICRRANWGYSRHQTDHAPQTTLLSLFEAMADEREVF
jgi:uncharacterized protein (DUF58 family)